MSIASVNLSFYWLEQHNQERIRGLRLLSLLVIVLVLSLFFSEKVGLGFNEGVTDLVLDSKEYLFLIEAIDQKQWLMLNILFMGSLLVANEVNLVIRYWFKLLDLEPKKKDKDEIAVDIKEYNAGRVIGILERLLIYIFVLGNQFLAIGLILTAKGLTRFKELEERRFAEYILIGTLLSTLLAVIVAVLVKTLLSHFN